MTNHSLVKEKQNKTPKYLWQKNSSSVLMLIQKYAVPGTKAAVY